MTGQEDIEVLGFRAFVQSTQPSMAQNAFFHTFMDVWGVHIDFLWAEQWEKWIKIRTRTFPEPQFPKLLHVLCFQLLCDEWCQATCVLLADRIAQARFVQSYVYVYFDGVWAALHGTSKMEIYFLPQQAPDSAPHHSFWWFFKSLQNGRCDIAMCIMLPAEVRGWFAIQQKLVNFWAPSFRRIHGAAMCFRLAVLTLLAANPAANPASGRPGGESVTYFGWMNVESCRSCSDFCFMSCSLLSFFPFYGCGAWLCQRLLLHFGMEDLMKCTRQAAPMDSSWAMCSLAWSRVVEGARYDIGRWWNQQLQVQLEHQKYDKSKLMQEPALCKLCVYLQCMRDH